MCYRHDLVGSAARWSGDQCRRCGITDGHRGLTGQHTQYDVGHRGGLTLLLDQPPGLEAEGAVGREGATQPDPEQRHDGRRHGGAGARQGTRINDAITLTLIVPRGTHSRDGSEVTAGEIPGRCPHRWLPARSSAGSSPDPVAGPAPVRVNAMNEKHLEHDRQQRDHRRATQIDHGDHRMTRPDELVGRHGLRGEVVKPPRMPIPRNGRTSR